MKHTEQDIYGGVSLVYLGNMSSKAMCDERVRLIDKAMTEENCKGIMTRNHHLIKEMKDAQEFWRKIKRSMQYKRFV